jgi:hypothetical protein
MVAFATSPSPVSGVRAAAIANVADESAASREEERYFVGLAESRRRSAGRHGKAQSHPPRDTERERAMSQQSVERVRGLLDAWNRRDGWHAWTRERNDRWWHGIPVAKNSSWACSAWVSRN